MLQEDWFPFLILTQGRFCVAICLRVLEYWHEDPSTQHNMDHSIVNQRDIKGYFWRHISVSLGWSAILRYTGKQV